MKYTKDEIFKKIERKEKGLRVGNIIKINREVACQHFEFTDNRNVFYPPLKTEGELGRIDRVYEIDIGNNVGQFPIPIEKLLDLKFSEKLSNRLKAKVGFRLENNPNRKIYVVYLIFTFKDKISEHYGQKDAYGILISDDMIPANETESRIFIEKEEKFKARRIAEQL
jgi:hypothetical protein